MAMIPFAEAQALILGRARSFGIEEVELERADGRVLAEPLTADRDYPPFNRAMMDGYAFMYQDWEQGKREYYVLETIFPGQAPTRQLTEGCCYKIMTGAAVPYPANAIIRREDARELGGHVLLEASNLTPFMHIARKGEDALAGSTLSSTPLVCTPALVSLLATIGKWRVKVMRAPTVALITTGNEVVSPEKPVSEFQIRNSNLFLLRSLLKIWQIYPHCEHLPDDQKLLERGLRSVLNKDIIIINGAVSAGDADYVPETLHSLGVRKLFHRVSIRPGKPIWCGETEAGGIVFALPGNPLSCLTTFTVFIQPFLHKCLGLVSPSTTSLTISTGRSKKSPLTEFFPVKVDSGVAQPILPNSSGDVTAAINADGLAMHCADLPTLEAGSKITVYPFDLSNW